MALAKDKHSLYENLKALEDASFPKACDKCGAIFNNEEEYISKSRPYQESTGFTEVLTKSGECYVKLIRECLCGQPILDHFSDRRDNSEQGEMRRKAFEKVIEDLVNRGFKKEVAREELLNHMKGRTSKVLTRLGVFSR